MTRHTCDSCFRDISTIVRAQCAVCDDVDLCVECLASGHSLTKHHHSPSHPYRLLRPFGFAICEAGWGADEEVALLEAIEANGMGNWEDAAEMMTGRTADECAEHYRRLYLSWHGSPKLNPELRLDSVDSVDERPRVAVTKPDKKAKSDASPAPVGYQSFPANHEIAGYMPLRDEFETVFDNDAEASIKDLAFLDTDSPFDLKLKRTMLDIYSGTLDRREARHRFAASHGLLHFKQQMALDKSRSKEERDVWATVKPSARFCSVSEFDEFVGGLVREAELRRRIASLQEYRRAGMRRLDEASRYEHEKKQLELYLKSGGAAIIHRPAKEPHPLPIGSTSSQQQQQQASQQSQPSSSQGRKASAPLNIANADGIEMLTEKERELCSILRLYPRVYLHIKDTLIKEYLQHGGLKRAQARAAVKIDVNKTSRLYDFFVSAGWIKAPVGDSSEAVS